MTTLVSTNIANQAALISWWAGIGADAISGDKQYVARLAAGTYVDAILYSGKTSDNGATDVGFGTSRIVITTQSGVWQQNGAEPLRYDSSQGVVIQRNHWDSDFVVQAGLAFKGLQTTGDAVIQMYGVFDTCFINQTENTYVYNGSKVINSVVFSSASAPSIIINGNVGCYGSAFVTMANRSVVQTNGFWSDATFIDCYAANLAASPTVDPWTTETGVYSGSCANNGSNHTSAGNRPGSSGVLFTNAALTNTASTGTLDLRLVSGSALSGVGVTNANLTLDMFGATRPGTPAIGPVEIAAAGDTTAPTLTSPTGTQTGSTTASGTVTTDEGNGTLYYLASTNATETAVTVKAASSQAVSGTGSQSVSFAGLTASTTYYAHYCHRDAAGNDSAVANSTSFTTAAASSAHSPAFYQTFIAGR